MAFASSFSCSDAVGGQTSTKCEYILLSRRHTHREAPGAHPLRFMAGSGQICSTVIAVGQAQHAMVTLWDTARPFLKTSSYVPWSCTVTLINLACLVWWTRRLMSFFLSATGVAQRVLCQCYHYPVVVSRISVAEMHLRSGDRGL